MEWNNISAAAAGGYRLTFRYANGGSSSRQAAILVNGENVGNAVFDSTGEWATWRTVSITKALRAGTNTIRVLANSSNGGPNLDSMVVTAPDECPNDPNKTVAGVCGCGTADVDRDSDGTMDCKEACPTDRNKTPPGACGCGVSEGSCGEVGSVIRLPIEVLGPSGTKETVSFELSSTTGVTHLLVTCHSCGYNDHALDSDPAKVKAAVRVNGGAQVPLKYYTLKRGGGIAGNAAIRLLARAAQSDIREFFVCICTRHAGPRIEGLERPLLVGRGPDASSEDAPRLEPPRAIATASKVLGACSPSRPADAQAAATSSRSAVARGHMPHAAARFSAMRRALACSRSRTSSSTMPSRVP